MRRKSRTRITGIAAVGVAAMTALALAAPIAQADNSRSRAAQVSPDAAAASVLTWPQLVKLLRIPKPGGWSSGDLTSWEIGNQVSGSRLFANVQTAGSFSMIYTGVDSFTDSGAAAQMWTMLAEAAAAREDVTVLSRTANESVTYGVGQYRERLVTVSRLFGTWYVMSSCQTRKPTVSVKTLTACAKKVAKAQQKKSAPVVAPA